MGNNRRSDYAVAMIDLIVSEEGPDFDVLSATTRFFVIARSKISVTLTSP